MFPAWGPYSLLSVPGGKPGSCSGAQGIPLGFRAHVSGIGRHLGDRLAYETLSYPSRVQGALLRARAHLSVSKLRVQVTRLAVSYQTWPLQAHAAMASIAQ